MQQTRPSSQKRDAYNQSHGAVDQNNIAISVGAPGAHFDEKQLGSNASKTGPLNNNQSKVNYNMAKDPRLQAQNYAKSR